jgi:hypothetical protein
MEDVTGSSPNTLLREVKPFRICKKLQKHISVAFLLQSEGNFDPLYCKPNQIYGLPAISGVPNRSLDDIAHNEDATAHPTRS